MTVSPAALACRATCGAPDVFVRRVRTRTDQRVADVDRIALLARRLAHVGDRPVEIRRVRTDEVGPELVEVDVDDAIEEPLRVSDHFVVDAKVLGMCVGEIGDRLAARRLQVRGRARVVAEQRARGADLGAHVADRGLARGRDGFGAVAEIFDDRTRAALHGENAGDLQDHVLRRGPARERAVQVHADELGHARVEGPARHDVDRVGAADADRDHPEATGVGRVAIGADHHPAGKGVLLEHDLVDDAGARLPEADAVLRRHGSEELVHLGVHVERTPQVDVGTDARLDEMVAVHGGRHLHARQAGGHELEQRHLRGGVLHGHAVGPVVGIVDRPFDADGGGVVGMGEQHLLGERQGTAEPAAGIGQRPGELGVDRLDELDGRGGPDALRHDVHLFRCSVASRSQRALATCRLRRAYLNRPGRGGVRRAARAVRTRSGAPSHGRCAIARPISWLPSERRTHSVVSRHGAARPGILP